jgi:hypothetical protein
MPKRTKLVKKKTKLVKRKKTNNRTKHNKITGREYGGIRGPLHYRFMSPKNKKNPFVFPKTKKFLKKYFPKTRKVLGYKDTSVEPSPVTPRRTTPRDDEIVLTRNPSHHSTANSSDNSFESVNENESLEVFRSVNENEGNSYHESERKGYIPHLSDSPGKKSNILGEYSLSGGINIWPLKFSYTLIYRIKSHKYLDVTLEVNGVKLYDMIPVQSHLKKFISVTGKSNVANFKDIGYKHNYKNEYEMIQGNNFKNFMDVLVSELIENTDPALNWTASLIRKLVRSLLSPLDFKNRFTIDGNELKIYYTWSGNSEPFSRVLIKIETGSKKYSRKNHKKHKRPKKHRKPKAKKTINKNKKNR